jgi:hypothetical protein
MAKKPATPVAVAKPSPVRAAKQSPQTAREPSTSANVAPVKAPTSTTLSPRSSPQDIALHVWNRYLQDTPSRTILLDVFLAFIALDGAVQFVYCILAGNYVSYSFRILSLYLTSMLALQRLPLRLRSMRRPIRPHHLLTNADLGATSSRSLKCCHEDNHQDD